MYGLLFVFGPVPPSDDIGWNEIYRHLEINDQLEIEDDVPDEVMRLYLEFCEEFPDLFPSGMVPDRPRGAPYLGPLTESVSVLYAPNEILKRLVPFSIELGRAFRITVFDIFTGHVHRPDGFGEIGMTVEHQSIFISPTFDQVSRMIDSMTPDGGPSTLILDASTGDYAQIAGGNGVFTCEWREYQNESFQHWVAGHNVNATREIRIRTDGYHVVVNSNERLSAADVKLILKDFAEGKPRSAKWQWRNITDQFQKTRTD